MACHGGFTIGCAGRYSRYVPISANHTQSVMTSFSLSLGRANLS